jgi:hypothetical protein
MTKGKRGPSKKDPFAALDDDFKAIIDSADRDQIRHKISEVSMNQVDLMQAKADDEDLARCLEEAKEAGAQYREGTKMNKLRIMYAKITLEGKGG